MDKDINQKLLGFFSKHVLQSYKRGEILIRAEEEPPGVLSTTQQLLYGNAYKRVASTFIVSAKRFGKSFKNKNVLIDIPLTHQDIANLAGITRETASISIEKLQSKGLIFRKSQKFIVKNLTNLELEASM